MQLKNVSVIFEDREGILRKKRFYALKDISLNINEGDLITVIGESGAGKTTLGRIIVGLQKPTKGNVIYKGYDIWKEKRKMYSTYRREVQLIPQDPYSTLPFNKTVEEILSAPILRWEKLSKNELKERMMRVFSQKILRRD
jgi:peptide/nickel transport system ATP-binding protein